MLPPWLWACTESKQELFASDTQRRSCDSRATDKARPAAKEDHWLIKGVTSRGTIGMHIFIHKMRMKLGFLIKDCLTLLSSDPSPVNRVQQRQQKAALAPCTLSAFSSHQGHAAMACYPRECLRSQVSAELFSQVGHAVRNPLQSQPSTCPSSQPCFQACLFRELIQVSIVLAKYLV